MRPSLKDVLIKDDDVLENDVGQERLMMSIERGRYYSLNEVAREIYDRCDGCRTLEEVVGSLLEDFDIEPAICQREVLEFSQRLVSEKLLRLK